MQLFYPSHDIALSNGVRHFNPPAAALRLQEDLASLYEVWNQPFLNHEQAIPLPWGWDYDTRKYIHDAYGIKMTQLPTDEDLELIRQLSSRKTTIKLHSELNETVSPFAVSAPQWLETEDQVLDFIRQCQKEEKRFVLKTPWSSSGRGLTPSHTQSKEGNLLPANPQLLMNHANKTIKRMGGIIGEAWVENKKQDFAMLFYAGSGEVRFVGYSLFDNDLASGGTTYRQGYLLSNDEIERRLSIEPMLLHALSRACEQSLTRLLEPLLNRPWHVGYLGIDMLTFLSSDKLEVHPCIELNLRCTMGVVCRLWYDQQQTEGIFRISPMQDNGHFKAEFLARP